MGNWEAALCAFAAAAAAFAAAACAAAAFAAAACAAAAFAAAAFAAAAFIAAAFVTAIVEATAASLYIERRATPAKDMGVQGIPMMASAFRTNPIFRGELGGKSAIDIKISNAVTTMGIKNLFIDSLLSSMSQIVG